MDSIVTDLLELFPDTVTYEAPLGHDYMGAPTGYDTAQDIQARCSQRETEVRGADGKLAVSHLTVQLAGVFGVTTKGRWTLPSRFRLTHPRAINVYHGTDENGAHHETVYF